MNAYVAYTMTRNGQLMSKPMFILARESGSIRFEDIGRNEGMFDLTESEPRAWIRGASDIWLPLQLRHHASLSIQHEVLMTTTGNDVTAKPFQGRVHVDQD